MPKKCRKKRRYIRIKFALTRLTQDVETLVLVFGKRSGRKGGKLSLEVFDLNFLFSESPLSVEPFPNLCLNTRLPAAFPAMFLIFTRACQTQDSILPRWPSLPPHLFQPSLCSSPPAPRPLRTPGIENTMFQLPNGDRSSRGTKLPPHRTGHSSCESAHHRYN